MTSEAATWESAVREQVRLVAGDWVDEVATAWSTFAAETRIQVVLHGGYDSGKTSLIKRFLVEDGTPLPDGLEVGARPTSYQVQRIASGDFVWVDTPGTDSGNADHDALAEEALTLADAVLVVLSPQLLSGAQGVVRGLRRRHLPQRGGKGSAVRGRLADRDRVPDGHRGGVPLGRRDGLSAPDRTQAR